MGPTVLFMTGGVDGVDEVMLTTSWQLGSSPMRIRAIAVGSEIGSSKLCSWRQSDWWAPALALVLNTIPRQGLIPSESASQRLAQNSGVE